MVMIVYNQAIEEEVEEMLAQAGVGEYTKWQRVIGRGEVSPPRLDTQVWPGANGVLCAVIKDKKRLQQLVKGLKALEAEVGSKGLFAIRWGVERIV